MKLLAKVVLLLASLLLSGEICFAASKGKMPSQKKEPATPSLQLSVASIGAQKIKLTWQKPATKFDFFSVCRSTNRDFKFPRFISDGGNDYKDVEIFDVDKKTTFDDSDLKPNTTYYYRVLVYAYADHLTVSNLLSVKTKSLPPKPKLQPVRLKLDCISPLRVISLSWTPYKSKDFSYYNIHRGVTPDFKADQSNPLWQHEEASQTRFEDDSLTQYAILKMLSAEGTTDKAVVWPKAFYYKIVVYNWDGRKTISNEVAVQVSKPGNMPPTPSVLRLESVFNARALLKWTTCKNVDFIGYQLHRSQQSGFVPSSSSLVGAVWDKEELEDKMLEAKTKYFYKVVTFNASGLTSLSNEIEVETLAPPQPASAPLPVILKLSSPPTFDSVSLQWTKSSDADFDSYELHLLNKPTDTPSEQTFYEGPFRDYETTFIDQELEEGTKHFYVVVTRNKHDQTSVSNVVEATTHQHPVKPKSLSEPLEDNG